MSKLPKRSRILHARRLRDRLWFRILLFMFIGLVLLVFSIRMIAVEKNIQPRTNPDVGLQTPKISTEDLVTRPVTFPVTKVIDGDTFEIRIPDYRIDRVRIKSIDTPEIRKAKCKLELELALEAQHLAESLLNKQEVALNIDPRRDPYGRVLADVTLPDGRDVGTIMLQSGLAVPWPQRYDWCQSGRR